MPSLIVFAGPSSIGKTFAAQALIQQYPNSCACAPVHTTRTRRPTETNTSERIFVSEESFRQMIQDDAFFVHEQFAGFLYGCSKEQLCPQDKHLIIGVPPLFLPVFAKQKDVLMVGLQAPPNFETMSEERMMQRGDSLKVREARRPFIRRDIEDLRRLQPLVNRSGKLFRVKDDSTIPTQVLPWIAERLGLAANY